MADDLTLRAVVEAVLDAKGFEDFKAKIRETGDAAGSAGQGLESAGAAFERLGHRLPHTAFHLLSYDLLENAGIQGHLRPLIMLSTTAMESLATATGATASIMAGTTLGISLLIPLLLAMRKHTDDTKVASEQLVHADGDLIKKLEELREKTGHLTEAQETLLAALQRVQRAQQQSELDALQKKLDETTKKYEEQNAAVRTGYMEMDRATGAIREVSTFHKEQAEAAAKTAVEVRNLKDQQTILRAQMDGTTEGVAKQVTALEQHERTLKKDSEATNEAARRQAAYLAAADEESRKNVAILEKGKQDAYNADFVEFAKAEEEKRKAALVTERTTNDLHRRMLAADVASARTLDAARIARNRQFQHELDQQVEQYRTAKVSEAEIAQFVEAEKARFAEEEARMEIELQRQKTQGYLQGAQMAVGAIEGVFGSSKATAYAQAIINTAQGVTMALATVPWPLDFVVAGIIAAMGAAQIAKISSTSVEKGGFDDPVSDLLARDYGRKWAADFTREVGYGFAAGLGEARYGGRGTVINSRTSIDRGTHIGTANFTGLLGTPGQAMLEFERQRIRVARIEDRTRRRPAS